MRSDCNIADIVIDAAAASTLTERTGTPRLSAARSHLPATSSAASTVLSLSQLRAARSQAPSFALQALAFMGRSLLQQRRELSSLYLELFLSFLSGSLMGATSGGASIFTGVLVEPFSLMSPAPALFSLPLLSFFIGLTIGVSASPPAVRVFGNEKNLVRSEGAAGCSRSAYYVGKSLSVMPRLTLCSFHFSSIFYLLMAPRASFSSVFAAIWALNYCVYGLAAFLSVLSREGNSALLAVIVSMALAALCGYSPSLADASSWGASFLWDLQCVALYMLIYTYLCRRRYTRWVAEAFFFSEVQPWAGVYNTKQVSTPRPTLANGTLPSAPRHYPEFVRIYCLCCSHSTCLGIHPTAGPWTSASPSLLAPCTESQRYPSSYGTPNQRQPNFVAAASEKPEATAERRAAATRTPAASSSLA